MDTSLLCEFFSYYIYSVSVINYIIPLKNSQLKLVQILFNENSHFQVPFGVIIFGRSQIENNQIEKPSTKAAWLLMLSENPIAD